MALYNSGQGGLFQRAQSQFQGAQAAMGKQTQEGARTETTGAGPGPGQMISQGIGLINLPNQIEGAWNSVGKGVKWLANQWGAPDTTARVAETGGQAVAEAANGIGEAVQLNAGAEVANGLSEQMYAVPEYLGGEPGLAQAAEQTAASINTGGANAAPNAGAQAAQGGLSTMGGVVGPSLGGVAGGLAGRELGKAIGGDTGAKIGGVAGSLGGAYLGGLAASSLAGMAGGAAGGAAAGAAAGSAVPGMGTLIGAGIGALTSFFL